MKYKNLGIGLAVIAGILFWQIISIAKTKPGFPEAVSESKNVETQIPAEDVSVGVNYLAGKSTEVKIVFEVALNTHSVNLNDVDFQKTMVMLADGKTYEPFAVTTSGADHHRSAELSFSKVGVPLKIVFLGTEVVEKKEFEFKELK
jgi:methyl coenzyme M reductase beta subunit